MSNRTVRRGRRRPPAVLTVDGTDLGDDGRWGMTGTVEVSRDVAADPAGAALLLTTSEALRWWPGLRVGPRDGEQAVAATIGSRRALERVRIEALPPRRTPTSFVARFQVSGGSYDRTDGVVTLVRHGAGTRATLALAGPRTDLVDPARRFSTGSPRRPRVAPRADRRRRCPLDAEGRPRRGGTGPDVPGASP